MPASATRGAGRGSDPRFQLVPESFALRGVSRNCADFVKYVINFYYPKALHRSVVV
jgi:hypothetical protein